MTPARFVCAGLLLASVAATQADPLPRVASASNMEIIGHSDLNGAGKGGEGLALRQYPDGRRILFLAHESAPMCVSIIPRSLRKFRWTGRPCAATHWVCRGRHSR